MAKKLTAFLGQYTEVNPNLHKRNDDEYDFFFKPMASGGISSHYNVYNVTSGGVAPNPVGAGTLGSITCDQFFRRTWTVPAGISTATFHIWGGGGSGAPSYCCVQGIPGGSGAYAYKTVAVTPGDTYTLCWQGAERHCCTRSFCDDGTTLRTDQSTAGTIFRGNRGGKFFVLGNGLENFCAEGGNPGIGACCAWGSNAKYSTNRGDDPIYAADRCMTLRMCDIRCASTLDSDNDVFAPAKYYGADGGSNGIYACHQISCCGTNDMNDNRCGDKIFVAYPGGLLRTRSLGHIEKPSVNGGVVGIKVCNIVIQPHGPTACAANTHSGYASWGAHMQTPGMGGLTPSTCGGTCCCGQPGAPGMLRISYS